MKDYPCCYWIGPVPKWEPEAGDTIVYDDYDITVQDESYSVYLRENQPVHLCIPPTLAGAIRVIRDGAIIWERST